MIKNHFGLEPHPSDDFIHMLTPSPYKKARALRTAYDILHAADPVALQILIDQVRSYAYECLALGKD